jgi:hypothetical protein
MTNESAGTRWITVTMTLMLVLSATRHISAEEPQVLNVPPDGFVTLFNGKDFTGLGPYKASSEWRKHWTIEDGVLKSHTSLPSGARAGSIGTEKTYRDFELRFEFRMPQKPSDSGILTRLGQINLMPSWRGPVGLEISPHGGEKWKEAQEARARSGLTDEDNRIGEWNQVQLRLVGRKVTVVLNGKTVFQDFEMPEHKSHTETGPIGFQKHYDKPDYKNKTDKTFPMHIEFRNIFVKELPSAGE